MLFLSLEEESGCGDMKLLTGCDSTSSLFKIGKRIAYARLVELIKTHPIELAHFGLTENVDDDVDAARRCILPMYASKREK